MDWERGQPERGSREEVEGGDAQAQAPRRLDRDAEGQWKHAKSHAYFLLAPAANPAFSSKAFT